MLDICHLYQKEKLLVNNKVVLPMLCYGVPLVSSDEV